MDALIRDRMLRLMGVELRDAPPLVEPVDLEDEDDEEETDDDLEEDDEDDDDESEDEDLDEDEDLEEEADDGERSARHRLLVLLGVLETRDWSAAEAAKHPRNVKGSAGGGRFRSVAERVMDAINGGDQQLGGFSQPQLKKAAQDLGLNPPAGMKLVPLKALILAHHESGGGVPDKPAPAKAAKKAAAPKFDPREVAAQVSGKSSEAEIIGVLASDPRLTSAKLRQVAEALNVEVPDTMRAKSALQLHIAEQYAQAHSLSPAKATPDDRIRAAYDDLVKQSPSEYVSLADIRATMPDLSRAEQDAAIKRLALRPDVRVIPVANLKSLTPADREGAIHLGGEQKHAISFGSGGKVDLAGPFDAASVRERLAGAKTREEGHAIVSGLTMAQMREVDPTSAKLGKNRAEVADLIVGGHVGSRLTFDAIHKDASNAPSFYGPKSTSPAVAKVTGAKAGKAPARAAWPSKTNEGLGVTTHTSPDGKGFVTEFHAQGGDPAEFRASKPNMGGQQNFATLAEAQDWLEAVPAKAAPKANATPAEILASLPADLTPAQKRARLRSRGVSKDEIDALVPLAPRKAAAPKATSLPDDAPPMLRELASRPKADLNQLAKMFHVASNARDPEQLARDIRASRLRAWRTPGEESAADVEKAAAGADDELRRGLAEIDAKKTTKMAARARELALLGVTRAAGMDITPGHDELHHYWTRGEGLAKWRTSPHPWTTLRDLLLEHVTPGAADRMASKWFQEVFGYASGSDLHRLDSGKPPRGHLVGPG